MKKVIKAEIKKSRSGGSYAAAGKSTGHTGSGMLAPTEKNLGKTRKQATFQSGGSLGMKSVKAGVDKNPSVTRADIITAGKQNAGKAQSGKKVSKKSDNPADEYKGMKTPKGKPAKDVGGEGRKAPFKSGGKMKTCKGGC